MVPLAYIDYELRRDYISEVLCINREKPKTNCEGKCYLKKKLNQAGHQQNHQSTVLQERLQLSFFNETIRRHLFARMPNRIELNYFVPAVEGAPLSYVPDIYQPPQGS
ncbi:MAG: hypothetical protein DHS20C17_12150 [Cyclobacteriaceae bacterium]|nr:MAG: hypothetical protein DHS20C17_12150 [Cyclobacteriaceae bacterium]